MSWYILPVDIQYAILKEIAFMDEHPLYRDGEPTADYLLEGDNICDELRSVDEGEGESDDEGETEDEGESDHEGEGENDGESNDEDEDWGENEGAGEGSAQQGDASTLDEGDVDSRVCDACQSVGQCLLVCSKCNQPSIPKNAVIDTPMLMTSLESWNKMMEELLSIYAPTETVVERASEPTAVKAIKAHIARRQSHGTDENTIPWCIGQQDLMKIAIQRGHMVCIALLLEQVPSQELSGFWRDNPWCAECYPHIAASEGYLPILQSLLDHRVNMDEADLNNRTPLNVAILKDHVQVVEYLLSLGVETEFSVTIPKWERGRSEASGLLEFAALCGSFELVKLLVKHGIRASDGLAPYTFVDNPLIASLYRPYFHQNMTEEEKEEDSEKMATFLLDYTEPTYLWVKGPRLLTTAMDNRCSLNFVQLLIDRGAVVNKNEHYSYDEPLALALTLGDLELIQLLLRAGAKCPVASVNKEIRQTYPFLVDTLLQQCYDLRIDGFVMSGDWDMVERCIKHGASPDGRRELLKEYVIEKGDDPEPVKKLLALGADVDRPFHLTPLYMAAVRNSVEHVKILLSHGANLSCPTGNNSSALHGAADYGHLEIVQILLDHGADTGRRPRDQKTVLELAKASKRQAVQELLEHHLREKGLPVEELGFRR